MIDLSASNPPTCAARQQRNPRWLSSIGLSALSLCALLAAAPAARAGLFDDDEARRAILDLRTRLAKVEEQQSDGTQQMQDQIRQLQRSLLDLTAQNEQLRSELAAMRGRNEQIEQALAETQLKQKDLSSSMDTRVRALEPQQVNLDGEQFSASAEEAQAFDAAIAPLREGRFSEAIKALQTFIKDNPSSGYLPAARYRLGNAQFGARQNRDALATFRAFVTSYPKHPLVPEAKLAQASTQIELGDSKGARRTLDELIKSHPQSEAAAAAKQRLAALK